MLFASLKNTSVMRKNSDYLKKKVVWVLKSTTCLYSDVWGDVLQMWLSCAPVPHSCCSHHQDLNWCSSTCTPLCHCIGGRQPAASSAVEQEHGEGVFECQTNSELLNRRTTGQTSYMSPVTAKSPVTAARSVTRQWQSFSHAALESFMACGQAGLGWATLSAALRSSCGIGCRRDTLGWDKHHTSALLSRLLSGLRKEQSRWLKVEAFQNSARTQHFAVTQHTVCLFDV